MRAGGALLAVGLALALGTLGSGLARADDDAQLLTGRSVAVSAPDGCDRVTPVCAVLGHGRLVPYDNECRARADGASQVSFSGCFDEN